MIDNDIRRLADQPPDTPLDHLEADIWGGVAAQMAARKTGRVIAACQVAVMVVALAGGAAVGAATAISTNTGHVIIGSSAELTPSNLLLGARL